jgi:hypothetical protein
MRRASSEGIAFDWAGSAFAGSYKGSSSWTASVAFPALMAAMRSIHVP